MKKIKILYCIEYLSSGGTEKQLLSLIEGLNRDRFQPHLCCLRNSIIGEHRRAEALDLFKRIERPKIQLDFISFRHIRSLFEIIRLIKFIKQYKIDIVQSYFQDPTFLGLLAAKLSGVKHVIACFRDMGFWRQTENDWKMKIVYKLCSTYIANSSAVRNLYMNLYTLPEHKFSVIYNGIDVQSFTSIAKKEKQEDKDIIVGIVANLNREVKRVDIFLKAAAHVLQQIGGIKFVVAGDGELREDLMKLSSELGICGNAEFLGRIENIPQLLSAIDIGVISSDSEGFSNAILEFMASGVPVIATDVGGNGEIIMDGTNGFLVPKGDYRALGERVIELATDNTTYTNIAERAFNCVSIEFSLKKYIENYESYYNEICYQAHM